MKKFVLVFVIICSPIIWVYGPTLASRFDYTDDWQIPLGFSTACPHPQAPPPLSLWKKVSETDVALGRFRPMYYVNVFVMGALAGTNCATWHAITIILCMVTAGVLYLSFRTIGAGPFPSLVFAWLTVLHPWTSEVWVRLALPEGPGALVVSLALLAIVKAARSDDGKMWDVVFVLSALAAGLAKESFILVIPALLFARIMLWKTWRQRPLVEALRVHMPLMAVLTLTFAILLLTAFVVAISAGTHSYGGRSLGVFSPSGFYCMTSCAWRFLFLAPGFVPAWLFLIALFVAAERSESSRLTFTYVIPAVIFCLLWLGPQILLYAMRGVFGSHYAMPAIIGAAAVNGLALDWLSKSRARILYVLAVLWAAACIGLGGIIVSGHVSQFRARTLALNQMIDYIRNKVPNGAPLIVVADPARSYEATVALIVYLGYAGRADIPIYLLSAVPDRSYSSDDKCLAENLAQTYFSNRHDLAAISPDRVGAVVLFAPVSRVPSCWQNWLRDARLEPVVFSVSWYALVAKQRGFIRGEATLTVLVPRPRHT